MKRTSMIIGMTALMSLAGCGGDDEGRGGVTAEEARELNNAAEMLDASPDSLVASEDAPLGNGEEVMAPSEGMNGANAAAAE